MAFAELGDSKMGFFFPTKAEFAVMPDAGQREFLQYCMQDTRLALRLRQKFGFSQLVATMSWTCRSPTAIAACYNTGKLVDCLFSEALAAQSLRLSHISRVPPMGIGGAYGMRSISGLMRNVLELDFKSMYPSIARSYNLSWETTLLHVSYSRDATSRTYSQHTIHMLRDSADRCPVSADTRRPKSALADVVAEWSKARNCRHTWSICTHMSEHVCRVLHVHVYVHYF